MHTGTYGVSSIRPRQADLKHPFVIIVKGLHCQVEAALIAIVSALLGCESPCRRQSTRSGYKCLQHLKSSSDVFVAP